MSMSLQKTNQKCLCNARFARLALRVSCVAVSGSWYCIKHYMQCSVQVVTALRNLIQKAIKLEYGAATGASVMNGCSMCGMSLPTG